MSKTLPKLSPEMLVPRMGEYSMISRALENLGLFMGYKKQRDHEALYFLNLNNWLMSQCGGAWDHPQATYALLEHRPARELAVKYIRFFTKTPRLVNYLGWQRYVRYRSLDSLDFLWGWKDPRNSLTLPFWKTILPELRLVVCLRHPVEVAKSLHARGASSLQFSFNLWLDYHRQILAHSSPDTRIVTHYDSYFFNCHQELHRLIQYVVTGMAWLG